ncbi:MAG: T9SS type A sorting domain-containing protein, partial [Bacteroidota bacterium]
FVFDADASMMADDAAVILASGFLTPGDNQDGAGFGLLLVETDGTATLLANTTSIFNDITQNNDLLQAYPNPVSDQLQIRTELSRPSDLQLQIFDATGRVVYQRSAQQVNGLQEWTVEVANLAAGVHTVIMRSGDVQAMQKIVVVK